MIKTCLSCRGSTGLVANNTVMIGGTSQLAINDAQTMHQLSNYLQKNCGLSMHMSSIATSKATQTNEITCLRAAEEVIPNEQLILRLRVARNLQIQQLSRDATLLAMHSLLESFLAGSGRTISAFAQNQGFGCGASNELVKAELPIGTTPYNTHFPSSRRGFILDGSCPHLVPAQTKPNPNKKT